MPDETKGWSRVFYAVARYTVPALVAAGGVGGLTWARQDRARDQASRGYTVLATSSNDVQQALADLARQVDQLEGHVRLMNEVLLGHVRQAAARPIVTGRDRPAPIVTGRGGRIAAAPSPASLPAPMAAPRAPNKPRPAAHLKRVPLSIDQVGGKP